MKKFFVLTVFFVFVTSFVLACDFQFSTKDNLKSVKHGDEIVIHVVLKLTHRNCKVLPKDTKFKYEGIDIVSATNWKQEDAMTYSREIKVKVKNDNSKAISLIATRSCDRDGGSGTFSLPINK